MVEADDILKKGKKEWFMAGRPHTSVPLEDYRFVKLKIDFNENGEDKFLFLVVEKNKFRQAMLDNCREYRFYDVKKDQWVREHLVRKRFFRKCPAGCKDAEFKVIEKPNAELLDKEDDSSWVFRDVWQCTECKKKWLITSHPEKGDSFEEADFLKEENGKRAYKTGKGIVKFGRSPSRI